MPRDIDAQSLMLATPNDGPASSRRPVRQTSPGIPHRLSPTLARMSSLSGLQAGSRQPVWNPLARRVRGPCATPRPSSHVDGFTERRLQPAHLQFQQPDRYFPPHSPRSVDVSRRQPLLPGRQPRPHVKGRLSALRPLPVLGPGDIRRQASPVAAIEVVASIAPGCERSSALWPCNPE